MTDQEIEADVRAVVARTIAGLHVDRVLVAEVQGEEESPALNVRVVYDDVHTTPVGEEMLDAQIEIDRALRQAAEARPLLLSFIARSDARQAA